MLTTEERVDRLDVLTTQIGVAMLRLERASRETDARLERASRETDARLEQLRRESDERLEQLRRESDERIEATITRLERASRETDARLEQLRRESDQRFEAAGIRLQEMNVQTDRRVEQIQLEGQQARLEAQRQRSELFRQLGEISNRQGTIVEDLIAPSIQRTAQEELDCGPLDCFGVRVKKPHPATGLLREFDVVVAGQKAVLLNQTKATARPEHAGEFIRFLEEGGFLLYFPEYRNKPLLPVFSSLYIPEDVLAYPTRNGVYAVAMGDESMQVLNLEQVRARPGPAENGG